MQQNVQVNHLVATTTTSLFYSQIEKLTLDKWGENGTIRVLGDLI